ncbi:MAG TPA: YihY/virulence factor BrkB family protein [Candidatus Binataceae bacterium]|nr:YihY/virulence factor BrkB family protein [Candidatus Binataceae bacterium]
MIAGFKEFLLQVLHDFSRDECPSMAAALAYATLFAMPSLLLILIFIAGLVLGPKAASGEIQARLSGAIGSQTAAQIQTMVTGVAKNRTGGLIATILGVVGLLVSATGVLAQLQQCLNKAWKVKVVDTRIWNTVAKRLRSGILLAVTGVLAILSVAAGSAITALAKMLPFSAAAEIGETITSLLIFAVVFAAILKFLPDVELSWSDVWAGGLIIGALFEIGKFLIAIYLAHAGAASAYGAAGSLAMILMWTYYSALILLLGVEVTQVWVRRGGRDIMPRPGAERMNAA